MLAKIHNRDPIPHLAALGNIITRLDSDDTFWIDILYRNLLNDFRYRIPFWLTERDPCLMQVRRVYKSLRTNAQNISHYHPEFRYTVYFYYSAYAIQLLNGFGLQVYFGDANEVTEELRQITTTLRQIGYNSDEFADDLRWLRMVQNARSGYGRCRNYRLVQSWRA